MRTRINPLLVDEQLRGGAVQGIGAAMFEHCDYSAEGQLRNGSLADYLVPMASEMPDIDIAHTSTPTRTMVLGAKGVGEAGTVGAPGAIWTAVKMRFGRSVSRSSNSRSRRSTSPDCWRINGGAKQNPAFLSRRPAPRWPRLLCVRREASPALLSTRTSGADATRLRPSALAW